MRLCRYKLTGCVPSLRSSVVTVIIAIFVTLVVLGIYLIFREKPASTVTSSYLQPNRRVQIMYSYIKSATLVQWENECM